MPDSPSPPPADAAVTARRRVTIAVAVLVVAAGGAAVWIARSRAAAIPPNAQPPALFVQEGDGLRYEYHAVAGTESLWEIGAAPGARRNLVGERPADAARLRETLRKKLGVKDLTELRAPHRELYEKLHELGYM